MSNEEVVSCEFASADAYGTMVRKGEARKRVNGWARKEEKRQNRKSLRRQTPPPVVVNR